LFLIPVFAIVEAYAAFRERLDWLEIGGVAFILAGIGIELHPKLETPNLL
jgi:drug/metabolite transporter (DMT)-like permease